MIWRALLSVSLTPYLGTPIILWRKDVYQWLNVPINPRNGAECAFTDSVTGPALRTVGRFSRGGDSKAATN